MNIAIVSLGCPKNQVDADVFCRDLIEAGHQTVGSVAEADVAIINTCGFIQSAKEEAIESILAACAVREEKPALKVIVTGCLAERYREEVAAELPEVDAVVGIGANSRLPEIVASFAKAAGGDETLQAYGEKAALPLGAKRVISTPQHYAWLKIAEGCSNACSYCAIPMIRGPLRSRTVADCVQEAEWLSAQGVKEIVLVAQDVTAFGEDRGESEIVPLLRALEGVEGVRWIRLLYAYPERITPALVSEMARNTKVVPYLDLPIQHINDGILASMRRRGDSATVKNAIAMIRAGLPGAVLRTTLIAGYPGETEEQFDELCAFVKEAGFDRLGCFAYSEEEGTPAATMENQLPLEVRQQRAEAVMLLQSHISDAKQQAMIGKTLEVVCDDFDDELDAWRCRSWADAPEIDANVLVPGEESLLPGAFYTVQVVDADPYDLYAELEASHEPA